jgi:hypothetical protein
MRPLRRVPAHVGDDPEIRDDDILEVRSAAASGTYAASAAPPTAAAAPTDRPPAPTDRPPAPTDRPADDDGDTLVSTVVGQIARLSHETSIPRIVGAVEWGNLEPFEEWILSLVRSGYSTQAILTMSPIIEDETLAVLARLIHRKVIFFNPPAEEP